MKTILLQGDLIASFKKYCSVLLRPDMRVLVADTAEQALDLHRRERANLIVADINMPGMGGDGLCSLIRKDETLRRTYVVLACSAANDDLSRFASCGANACLMKPIDPEKLYGAVCQALDMPERKGLRVLVKVTVHGRFKNEPFFCLSKDVSVSGLLLETKRALAKGDVITCSFFLPETDRIDARAEVARADFMASSQNFNCSVKFDSLPPDAEKAIRAFVMRAAALTDDDITAITIEAVKECVDKKDTFDGLPLE